ncbi:MAG: VOC family protein [Chloroflexota bacterium]
MRVGHVEVPVSEPLRSLSFYRDVLGFALEANQGDRHLWLANGEFVLLLRPGFAGAPNDDVAGINLVLYTDDYSAAAARLRERGVAFTERANCLHLRDPDGHWIQIVDPSDDHSGG